jgi:phage FluMu gp28-like protein
MTFSFSIFELRVTEMEQPPQAECAHIDIIEFAQTRLKLGFELDAQQVALLRSEGKRAIVNCCRQWGKSTVAAVKAIHRAYTQAGVTVLVASPSERQSGEFIRKVAWYVGNMGIRPRRDGYNRLSVKLPNGSRIVGLPGTEQTVRGFTASLILIDEAAGVKDAMYRALRPMMAVSNGDLWMMSTPKGKRGFFYETWTFGGERWLKMSVPATELTRISSEFLEEERSESGEVWVQQEYLCQFVDGGGGVFSREMIEAAFDDECTELGFLRFQAWNR